MKFAELKPTEIFLSEMNSPVYQNMLTCKFLNITKYVPFFQKTPCIFQKYRLNDDMTFFHSYNFTYAKVGVTSPTCMSYFFLLMCI